MKRLIFIVIVLGLFVYSSPFTEAKPLAHALKNLYHGGAEAVIALMSENVTWRVMGDPTKVPLSGDFVGHDGVRQHLAAFSRAVKVSSIHLEYAFPDENNRFHVIFSIKGMVRESGNRFDMEFAHLISLDDDGLIKDNHIFYDTITWWAAFYGDHDVTDRRGVVHYGHLDQGDLGAHTQIISDGYKAFIAGDIAEAMANFSHDEFYWILKGDAVGDDLGTPSQGIRHVGLWEGLGDPDEIPFPSWGFLGTMSYMLMSYEYVPPEAPQWEMPFQVKYIGSNSNLGGANIREIQHNLVSGLTATIDMYHFFIFDDEGKIVQCLSFNDSAVLCSIDPNCAFCHEMKYQTIE